MHQQSSYWNSSYWVVTKNSLTLENCEFIPMEVFPKYENQHKTFQKYDMTFQIHLKTEITSFCLTLVSDSNWK